MKKRIAYIGTSALLALSAPLNNVAYAETVSEIQRVVEGVELERVVSYDSYVVGLLNQVGRNTSINNWRQNLLYLEEDYELLSEIPGVNMTAVDYYIGEYSSQVEFEKMNLIPNEAYSLKNMTAETNDTTYATTTSLARTTYFSYINACNYAEEYYRDYNPEYPNWGDYGGDCANFVSQCLVAGGLSMEDNSQNDALDWYSYGNKCDTTKVAAAFRGANAFKNRFIVRAARYTKVDKGATREYLYDLCGRANAISFCKIENGSIIAKHTMIVVSKNYTSKIVYLAGHSRSTHDTDLYTKLNSYDCCYVFAMK